MGDVEAVLRSGADKVSVNTAAIKNPKLITDIASRFGSQCMVLSIQAKRQGSSWEAYFDNGREHSGLDAIEWAERGQSLGAGEILLTSVDQEGTGKGIDLALVKAVSDRVEIPVIAAGGIGCVQDLVEAVQVGKADAIAMAHVLHYDLHSIPELRQACRANGISVRNFKNFKEESLL